MKIVSEIIEPQVGDLLAYHPTSFSSPTETAIYLGQDRDGYNCIWAHDCEAKLVWGRGDKRFRADTWTIVSRYADTIE